MRKISGIITQRLGPLIDNFHVCPSCGVVDADPNRTQLGYLCKSCSAPSKGGYLYFSLPTDSLIDLMQESFHQKTGKVARLLANDDAHKLSVVIYFCTLVEVLLEHFLRELMNALQIPHKVQERLLTDNPFSKSRVGKVFPSLVGEKWNAVVKELSKNSRQDYEQTAKYYLKVAEARNHFLHRGNKWAVPQSMPAECMESILPLLNLFVSLHNRYIPTLYADRGRKYH